MSEITNLFKGRENEEVSFEVDEKKYLLKMGLDNLTVDIFDEEGNELFWWHPDITIEQLNVQIRFFEITWRKAFKQGERSGINKIKQQIKEVVSFFAAGFLKEDKE